MKTKAVRIHGKNDLRLDEFELPEIKDDEILARILSDSLCMSTYKAAIQGTAHKRIHDDVAENPTILGHEMCGEIVEIGSKWADKYKVGQKFSMQTALLYNGSLDAPGYSYKYVGGDATYVVIPQEVMLLDKLLDYNGDSYYPASMAEPYSCVIGTFHAMYHTVRGSYEHAMGIKEGGSLAMLASVGPMGLAAIDYIIHCDRRPSVLTITDINQERLDRAERLLSPAEAAKNGIKLTYLNTADMDAKAEILKLNDGKGYDDVIVFAPVPSVVELGDSILGEDGCLNFFSGPPNAEFKANLNFYNIHYLYTHVMGTTGGNTDDMQESLDMMSVGKLNPAVLITHIGGLNSAAEATLHLPDIPGGKKLIYTHLDMPLTAIDDFEELGKNDPMYAELARLVKKTNGLWNPEAEKYLIDNCKKID